MITIVNRRMKCGICGKPGEGLLFRNMRLDRLTPVFLCYGCLERVRDLAGEPASAAPVPDPDKEDGKGGKAEAEERKGKGRPEKKRKEAVV